MRLQRELLDKRLLDSQAALRDAEFTCWPVREYRWFNVQGQPAVVALPLSGYEAEIDLQVKE